MSVKRIGKAVAMAAGGLGLLCAVYGLAFHTQAGRDFLGYKGSCPVAAGRLTPKEQDAEMRAQSEALRGSSHAAARPALGFAFETTSRSDLDVWAKRVNARCNFARAMNALECRVPDGSAVPEGHVPGGEVTLFFGLDSEGRLKAVDLQAEVASGQSAVQALQGVRQTLVAAAGAPTAETGSADASYLARGTLTQASAEFRFDNYYAVARATNMGPGGYSVSQSYRSLVN